MEFSAKKTLAQLEDKKEKKYVTAEVGSSLSGYTKDYLERLCRLDKVEYRLRKNGQYAIELSSLLSETHTILVSFEGITYVDKNDLLVLPSSVPPSLPVGLNAISASAQVEPDEQQPPELEAVGMVRSVVKQTPHFGEFTHVDSDLSASRNLAFVGRSFVSDPLQQQETKEAHDDEREETPTVTPKAAVTPSVAAAPPSPASVPPAFPPPPLVPEKTELPVPVEEHAQEEIIQTPVYIPVVRTTPTSHATTPSGFITAIPSSHARKEEFPQATVLSPVHIPHEPDDWDALFREAVHDEDYAVEQNTSEAAEALSSVATAQVAPVSVPPLAQYLVPSRYRPIQTSLDSTLHHDDAPLFPVLKPKILIPVVPDVPELPAPPSGEIPMKFDPLLPMTSPVHDLMTPEPHLPSKVSRF